MLVDVLNWVRIWAHRDDEILITSCTCIFGNMVLHMAKNLMAQLAYIEVLSPPTVDISTKKSLTQYKQIIIIYVSWSSQYFMFSWVVRILYKKVDTLMPEFTYPQKKKKDKSIGGFLVKAIEQFLWIVTLTAWKINFTIRKTKILEEISLNLDVHKVPLTCSSSIVSKILTEVEVRFQLFLYSNC